MGCVPTRPATHPGTGHRIANRSLPRGDLPQDLGTPHAGTVRPRAERPHTSDRMSAVHTTQLAGPQAAESPVVLVHGVLTWGDDDRYGFGRQRSLAPGAPPGPDGPTRPREEPGRGRAVPHRLRRRCRRCSL